jgi:hypothetical protein
MFAVNSHRFRIQFDLDFATLKMARDLIGHKVLQRSCYFVKLLKQPMHVATSIRACSPRSFACVFGALKRLGRRAAARQCRVYLAEGGVAFLLAMWHVHWSTWR